MVLIYINVGNSKCMMVDGFMPATRSYMENFTDDVYRKIDKNTKTKQNLEYNKNLKDIFQKETFKHMIRFCKQNAFSENDLEHRCSLACLLPNEIDQMLKQNTFKKKRWKDIGIYLSTLSAERNKGNKRYDNVYMHNIIINNNRFCSYLCAKECCINWMQEMNFISKEAKKYKNFTQYVTAWIDILTKIYCDRYVKILSEI